MTEVIEPAIETVTIDVVLSALADPVRLTLVRALDEAGDWTCGSDVLKETGVTIGKSTVSHHIKVLRDAGLIRTRVDGIRRLVTLRYDDVEQRFPGLLTMLREAAPARAAAQATTSSP
ncbi:ArsR/SmtB family transcription factor [Micromonospora saelicesensis]|uniref:Transcriptional regulator, ArsR family n=1 Tax=Micromonospora saelicesensis TaxID=285676 RepID=A0A1C4WQU8_9ACTN|nr:metalloregulator ArsR/SmtB family transcription factor [Micromonospora saelicesensis]RAO46095.1 putative HTH-type transcriptional regulat or YczG [Micromonospora saelicesensis]SCE98605.1 transcriptional regulator, ArsR family [Micromonospora saelicesensis]